MADEEHLAAKSPQERQTISDDDVRTVINVLMDIVKNPRAPHRSKTSAARVLLGYRRLECDQLEGDLVERLEAIEERNEQARY
jgi:hypothetical protein